MIEATREKQMAHLVTMSAKFNAHPTVVRFHKLNEYAKTKGLDIKPEGDEFYIYKGHAVVHICDTTQELNVWFDAEYGEEK